MQKKSIKIFLIINVLLFVSLLLTSCIVEKKVNITAAFPDYFLTSETLTIDFSKYVDVTDVDNPDAKITSDMLDISDVNCQVPGQYIIKVTYTSLAGVIHKESFIVTFTGENYSDNKDQPTTKLIVPSNIQVTDLENLTVSVTFTRVSSATSYLMKLYNSSNQLISSKEISSGDKITFESTGNYYLTIQAIGDGKFVLNSDVSSQVKFTVTKKTTLKEPTVQLTGNKTYLQDNFSKLNDGILANGIPSVGSPKVLVIPVEFSDTTLSSVGVTRSNIEKGFFGTSSDTGWESLSSFYEKSSYGALKLSGTVLPTYKAKKTSTYYSNLYNKNGEGDITILEEVLDYYDSSIDFSEYDYNNDGFIDGIYLVYAHKQDYEDSNLWWAWQNWAAAYDLNQKYDGVKANYYMWASAGFILEGIDTGNGYDYFDYEAMYDSSLKLNMHTFIHETGHMFGLDDYYDYDSNNGPSGGLGGADIMDYTVGDHCPFSKMMLGWVNPIIVLDTVTLEISSFTKTGQCIMIPKGFTNNGYFTEYLTIDLYTPTGLNELDAEYLFTKTAVRIMQVDATFNFNFDMNDNSTYSSAFKYNNSTSAHKQIRYIEANGEFDIEKTTSRNDVYADNDDLFDAGDYFEVSNTKWKNLTWYDGTKMNFKITIDKIVNETATITITVK